MDGYDILHAGSPINEALTGLINQINSVEIECYLLNRLMGVRQGNREPQALGVLQAREQKNNRGEL